MPSSIIPVHCSAVALSEFEKKRISVLLERYCDQRVPPRIRHQVKMGFEFLDDSVTLFESRPSYLDPKVWSQSPIAQFQRADDGTLWKLFCRDRNCEWHLFEPNPASPLFEDLLNVVDEDSTCIFYG